MVDQAAEKNANQKQSAGNQHRTVSSKHGEQLTCVDCPRPCSHRAADADDRQQPFPLLRVIQIVRQRPELRDNEKIENSDPEKEQDADMKSCPAQHVKDCEMRREKESYGRYQPVSIYPGGKPAV